MLPYRFALGFSIGCVGVTVLPGAVRH